MSSIIPRLSPGIYKITCIPTGKIYIGSSQDVSSRLSAHRWMLKKGEHHSPYLQAAWNKYTPDDFLFEVLEYVSLDALLEREQFYLDTLRPYDQLIGFNISRFADSSARGRVTSDATKKKLSKVGKGRVVSSDVRQRIAEKLRGHEMSEETRRKIGEKSRLRKHSEETRRKISEIGKGRTLSDEARQRMSEAKKGKTFTAEHKQKLSIAARNRRRKN